MVKKKPQKVPFDQIEIDTWQPTRETQPWLAMFRGLPMRFTAPTQDAVICAAMDWRKAEIAKEASKKANAIAASERMKARHADNQQQ